MSKNTDGGEKTKKEKEDKMTVTEKDGKVRISGLEYFSVNQTFDCGQCFRFDVDAGSAKGTAMGKEITFSQISDSEIEIYPCTAEEFETVWKSYLSLDEDYGKIRESLKNLRKEDKKLSEAMETGKGIRILRQSPFETLISFIISQNNNIPRIKKLISALCAEGARISGGSEKEFPSPEVIMKIGIDGLRAIKTGFRAEYIVDAAEKVKSGEVDLGRIKGCTVEEGAAELCKIRGVGPKVAACTLLFGFEKYSSFPIDVWVKRVMKEYYGDSVGGKDFGEYAGLAQQYLFYRRRYIEENRK